MIRERDAENPRHQHFEEEHRAGDGGNRAVVAERRCLGCAIHGQPESHGMCTSLSESYARQCLLIGTAGGDATSGHNERWMHERQ